MGGAPLPKGYCSENRRASRSLHRCARLQREFVGRGGASLASRIPHTATHDSSRPAPRSDGLEISEPLHPCRRPDVAITATTATIGPDRRIGARREGSDYRDFTGGGTVNRNTGTSYSRLRMGGEFAFGRGRENQDS